MGTVPTRASARALSWLGCFWVAAFRPPRVGALRWRVGRSVAEDVAAVLRVAAARELSGASGWVDGTVS